MSKHVIHDDGASPLILYIYRKKHPQTPKPSKAKMISSKARAVKVEIRKSNGNRNGSRPDISEGMKRWHAKRRLIAKRLGK